MKKVLLIAVVAVVALVIAASLFLYSRLDSLAKTAIESIGSSVTGTQVKVDSVKLSPREGSGELHGFSVANPSEFKSPTAIQAGTVAVAVNLRSLRDEKLVIPSIKILAPEITFEGSLQGNNLSALLANVSKGKGTPEPATKGNSGPEKKLQVDDILISDAKVHVAATLLGGTAASVTLPEIHLSQLGQNPEGITAREVSEKILAIILQKTLEASAKDLGAMGKQLQNSVGSVSGIQTNAVDAAKKGLQKLFK